jgi:hypothetical protein
MVRAPNGFFLVPLVAMLNAMELQQIGEWEKIDNFDVTLIREECHE